MRGEKVSIIGPSGSGKTTLARLIARFFDVSQGSVSIGSVDVRQIGSPVLATQISQIFQDDYLFAGALSGDGSLVVGDSHDYGDAPDPFQHDKIDSVIIAEAQM